MEQFVAAHNVFASEMLVSLFIFLVKKLGEVAEVCKFNQTKRLAEERNTVVREKGTAKDSRCVKNSVIKTQ